MGFSNCNSRLPADACKARARSFFPRRYTLSELGVRTLRAFSPRAALTRGAHASRFPKSSSCTRPGKRYSLPTGEHAPRSSINLYASVGRFSAIHSYLYKHLRRRITHDLTRSAAGPRGNAVVANLFEGGGDREDERKGSRGDAPLDAGNEQRRSRGPHTYRHCNMHVYVERKNMKAREDRGAKKVRPFSAEVLNYRL